MPGVAIHWIHWLLLIAFLVSALLFTGLAMAQSSVWTWGLAVVWWILSLLRLIAILRLKRGAESERPDLPPGAQDQ